MKNVSHSLMHLNTPGGTVWKGGTFRTWSLAEGTTSLGTGFESLQPYLTFLFCAYYVHLRCDLTVSGSCPMTACQGRL